MKYPKNEMVIWQMEFIDNRVSATMASVITQVVDQIKSLKNEMTAEMTAMRLEMSAMHSELKNDISNLRTEMKEDMGKFRLEVKDEIHGFRYEMNARLVAVETKLGISTTKRGKIADRVLDYSFKAAWIIFVYFIVKWHIGIT